MQEFKVVVMGYGGVGKSAVVVQFVQEIFIEKYDPTIEDSYRKQIEMDETQVMVEILDTAGREQFAAMTDLYIKNGDGFILMYAIVNTQTLIDLIPLSDHIADIKGHKKSPMILCGNKCDMESDRTVSREEGELYAQDIKAAFFETSAKTRTNVHEMFTELVRQMQLKQSKPSKHCSIL